MEIKKCPFNNNPCMEKSCVLFDSEIAQCEFKDLTRYIGECFNELIQKMEQKDDD